MLGCETGSSSRPRTARSARPRPRCARRATRVGGGRALAPAPGGARFWASGLLMPMQEAAARGRYLKIRRDRTGERGRRGVRESEERLRALLESSPARSTPPGRHLVFANAGRPSCRGGLARRAGRAGGLRPRCPGGPRAGPSPDSRAVRAGLAELTFQRLDGTRFPVEADAAAVLIDGRLAVQVVVRDVAERRRAEAHQRLLLRELSHRVKNTLAVVQGIAARSLSTAARSRRRAKSPRRLRGGRRRARPDHRERVAGRGVAGAGRGRAAALR